jgi:hypothetical protein
MIPMRPSHQTPGPVPVKASDPEEVVVAPVDVAVECAVVAVAAAVVVVGGMTSLPALNEIGTAIWSLVGVASSPTAITQVIPADT